MAKPILILVRHGDIEPPEDKLFGQLDLPLSEKAHKQMEDVGKKIWSQIADLLNEKGSNIQIYCSDLVRCTESLDIILDVFKNYSGKEFKKRKTKKLREYHLGQWEDQYSHNVAEEVSDFVKKYWKNPWHASPPKGESHYKVAHRVAPLVKELNKVYHETTELSTSTEEEYSVHLWVVHEGSARMVMQLLNVDTEFRIQDVEGEFIKGEHQTFFQKGDFLVLEPQGTYDDSKKHPVDILLFEGTTPPDALNWSLDCHTAWKVVDQGKEAA